MALSKREKWGEPTLFLFSFKAKKKENQCKPFFHKESFTKETGFGSESEERKGKSPHFYFYAVSSTFKIRGKEMERVKGNDAKLS